MSKSFLFALLAALVAVPGASALTLSLPAGARLDGLTAPPGEPLVVVADGDLVLSGTLQTTAAEQPGAPGLDITLQVHGTLTLLPGARLVAADGRDAPPVSSVGTVVALPGGDGGSIHIEAHRIVSRGAVVQAGSGGDGAAALALGSPHARAVGGDGGNAGSVAVLAPVEGWLSRSAGHGGHGGQAQAQGAAGQDCTAADGSPAFVQGENVTVLGHGGDANATATPGSCGPADGAGGSGGDAVAYGGNGGTAPDGNGGDGGDALAYAGRGGDGMHACFTSTKDAVDSGIQHAGNGGNGGNITAFAGNGGPGQNGGRGGSAYGWSAGGDGGNATMPIAYGVGAAIGIEGRGVKGGNGGLGALGDGGGGGAAVAETFGGKGGIHCGPLPYQNNLKDPSKLLPSPGLVPLLALLGLVALLRRRPA